VVQRHFKIASRSTERTARPLCACHVAGYKTIVVNCLRDGLSAPPCSAPALASAAWYYIASVTCMYAALLRSLFRLSVRLTVSRVSCVQEELLQKLSGPGM